jgi:hypothetical protein
MSTSLLYHAFGIRGDDYVRSDYQEGQLTQRKRKDAKDTHRNAGRRPAPDNDHRS